MKLAGMRGSPERCVARSSSVMCFPPRDGTFTPWGRHLATGSSRLTTPRLTMSASSVVVNVLVTEPISKTLSPSTAWPSAAVLPQLKILLPSAWTMPATNAEP